MITLTVDWQFLLITTIVPVILLLCVLGWIIRLLYQIRGKL